MTKEERYAIPRDYIQSHYQPSDRLAVVKIERPTGHVQQQIRTAEDIVDWKYQAHLRGANATGSDIYLTVNALSESATGRTKNDIGAVRHVYLDIDTDGKAVLDKILAREDIPNPHSVLETSPDKYQALWRVEGFSRIEAETLVRGMAKEHNADQAVWDTARILRVPGFRNCKYSQAHYVKETLSTSPEKIYRPSDFPRYELAPALDAPRFGDPRSRVSANVGSGSQSERDWNYAMRSLEKGRDPGAIEREIAAYRKQTGDKAYPEAYAKRTVLNAQMRLASRPMPAVERAISSDRGR